MIVFLLYLYDNIFQYFMNFITYKQQHFLFIYTINNINLFLMFENFFNYTYS